jgi:hypothetical protein
MSTPYSISLLNDLHNYFPDLLYQSQRFQSVPDVLHYVISVANQNPYERERALYAMRAPQVAEATRATRVAEAMRAPQVAEAMRAPQVAEATRPAAVFTSSATSTASMPRSPIRSSDHTSNTFYQLLHGARLPESEIVFSSRSSRPSSSRAFLGGNWMGGDSSSDTILSSLIGQIFEAPSLQTFLDQTVTVHPTAEQINQHTIATTAPRTMDDNCAICQDPIEQGQQMRILNYCTHLFHSNCIDTWFTTHVTCPTCRHDIRNT